MAGNGLKSAVNETVFLHPLSYPVVPSASTYNSFLEKRKGRRRVDGMERDEERERKMAIHDWIDERGSKVMNVHLFVLSPAEKENCVSPLGPSARPPPPSSSGPSSDRVVSPYLLDLVGDSWRWWWLYAESPTLSLSLYPILLLHFFHSRSRDRRG